MLEFLTANWVTIVLAAVLSGLVILAYLRIRKQKKCDGSCSGCAADCPYRKKDKNE